jgi:thiol:disulfide interchange protein DsbD
MHTLKIILSIPILLTFFWLSSVLYIQLSHRSAADTAASELVWQPYNAEQIAELNARKENIFVDFTADWCLTCKFNHAVMINTKRFKKFVKKNNVRLFMADLTEDNEIYNAAHNYYGRDSIPLYIYYKNGNYQILPLFFSIKSLEED